MGILDTIAPATCASCAYWHVEERFRDGQCRRHAPTMCPPGPDDPFPKLFGVWPFTESGFSCGDWERRLESLQP